ncbi:MAG: elongation factor 4 [Ruminococcaceae bacterium]|nr:elongation factor 4 [Oscillospiraceae bacterium]
MLSYDQKNIRNFSIIAHIDHGKSTLADRLLEATRTVAVRDMEAQLLDNMDLERERGITIKARAVRLDYTAKNGEQYVLNLIDTPGHVDFNYEVSRSLNACDGALLVVDSTQGIEAQTLANAYLAIDADLEIIPVINKIDLPSAQVDRVRGEIEDIIGIPAENCPAVSAKTGLNIDDVLEAVVNELPAPKGDPDAPLACLIFDSYYDSYLGVVVYIRVKDGTVKEGDRVRMMATGAEFEIIEVGTMEPFGLKRCGTLSAGEVGYITASIKNVRDTQVGDTVTHAERPVSEPLPGFRAVQSMVYAGIYPADGARYGDLRDALEKLRLNDAALNFEPETSAALGFGFRCGFLGLLHMEIIEERLEREFNFDLITTAPSVIYEVALKNGDTIRIDNPSNYPATDDIDTAYEPMVKASVITPQEFVGGIMDLCQDRRGVFVDMKYIDSSRVELHYTLPLNEIIYDFFDALKSRSKGYASLDYEMKGYEESDLVKLDFLLNGETVDALSFIVHESKAYARARKIAEKLKENIPRQLFEVPIQAAIGSRIIARETVKAMRKDVLAKCYGGDITRKKKLLEKQKEGKKKMRKLGSVEVSPEAFMAVLRLDEE